PDSIRTEYKIKAASTEEAFFIVDVKGKKLNGLRSYLHHSFMAVCASGSPNSFAL
ncbi:MAG: hypothetical protein K0S12_2468, partial [Bacteroidetes bacterium]|nr:hypothetical protein [Bacteroidota bacterium]